MRSITAIELGQDSCVLARTRRNRAVTEVSAVHGVREGEGALPEVDRGQHLRRLRRKGRFPRRARVVGWSLEDGAAPSDPLTRAALAPLLEAGFVLDAVMTPPEALAALAKSRPRAAGRGATAWLSLNRHAAAIAIVNGGDLLFSRVFSWNYRPSATLREELLQRYSLVAHLAPELRHGFDVVRGGHGVTVDGIVTCGDLPDLRSLTMPLIEELDLEVETLDSLDGLEIVGPAASQDLSERAPALRLACAAADGRPAGRPALMRIGMTAAALLVATLALWTLWWFQSGGDGDSRAGSRPRAAGSPVAAVPPAAGVPARPASGLPPERASSATPPPPSSGSSPLSVERASSAPPSQPSPGSAPLPGSGRASSTTPPPRPGSSPLPAASGTTPPPRAPDLASSRPVPDVGSSPPAAGDASAGAPEEPVERGGGVDSASVPAATTGQRGSPPEAVAPKAPPAVKPQPSPARPVRERPAGKPAPLAAPLPVVNSILVAPERRLAVVDGAIVREGDRVGPRVLARIEPAALILREPSGLEVRVPIRRRIGADR
jgi:hypothetical protein